MCEMPTHTHDISLCLSVSQTLRLFVSQTLGYSLRRSLSQLQSVSETSLHCITPSLRQSLRQSLSLYLSLSLHFCARMPASARWC
jgi:hypothetical protein